MTKIFVSIHKQGQTKQQIWFSISEKMNDDQPQKQVSGNISEERKREKMSRE